MPREDDPGRQARVRRLRAKYRKGTDQSIRYDLHPDVPDAWWERGDPALKAKPKRPVIRTRGGKSKRQQGVGKARSMMAKGRKVAVVHVRRASSAGGEKKPGVPSLAGSAHGGGLGLIDLDAGGLASVVLDLVGEGSINLGSALSAWQREQDRVTNRSWRRPGGLVRFPGVF